MFLPKNTILDDTALELSVLDITRLYITRVDIHLPGTSGITRLDIDLQETK